MIRAGTLAWAALGLWSGALAAELPDNPLAIAHCEAMVRIDAARLRALPSLSAPILGLKRREENVVVSKVMGKWVQVVTESRDTAFMAAYLLSFPSRELLEQWKRAVPQPSLGKKARVKWASLNFRKYPSKRSELIGFFEHEAIVAELSRTKSGWSFVQCQNGLLGFVDSKALEPTPVLPDFPEWGPPLSPALGEDEEALKPKAETPGDYLARTIWSPDIFKIGLKRSGAAETQPTLIAAR